VKYTPKTEDQLVEESLLPEGIYDFEVASTDDKPSKAGNDMITLKLFVFSDFGTRYVTDYIALGNTFGERKLRHAAVACGLLEEYDSGGIVADDFYGKTGKVSLKKVPAKDDFPPKNAVADYQPREENYTPQTKPTREIIDDDLPL
jgi:hypothetical protein